jgi:hypothetical protein
MYSRSRAVKLIDDDLALRSMVGPIARLGQPEQSSREMCNNAALALAYRRSAPQLRASAGVSGTRGDLRGPFGYALRWREARS